MERTFNQSSCRACMCPLAKQKPVFMDSGCVKIFCLCTSLEVDLNESLPSYLCNECFDKLKKFHKFREMCTASDKVYRETVHVEPEFLDYEYIIKTEPTCDEQIFYDNIDSVMLPEIDQTVISANALPVIGPSKRSDAAAPRVRSLLYICAICDQPFQTKKILQKHFKSHGFKPYTCEICNNNFGSRSTYYRHNRLKHRPIPLSRHMCTWPYCDKSYRHKQTLVKHIDTSHLDKKPQKEYLKPKPTHTIPTYECDICGKVRYRKHRILGHLRQHMGLKPFACKKCDAVFNRWSALKSHNGVRHNDGRLAPKYHCDIEGCQHAYFSKQALKQHNDRVHLGIRPTYQSTQICETCGKSFLRPFLLKQHILSHLGNDHFPHGCKLCPKRFLYPNKLRVHMLRHNNVKNFECPVCGLRTTTKSELNKHMHYHTKDRTVTCKHCSAVFNSKSNLERHIQNVHCGRKSYHCTFCTQSFSKAETLKHHTMRHTGEKPHACIQCDRRFIQAIALKTHMRTHAKKLK